MAASEHAGLFQETIWRLYLQPQLWISIGQTISREVQPTGDLIRRRLETIASEHGDGFAGRERGMTFDCQMSEVARAAARKSHKELIVEPCESANHVVKMLT